MAVLIAIAKQIPWAGRIMAVFTPITCPRESTSGPPELPGFRAASVWSTSSISRPDPARSDRPRALTTPAVTELWKPYGWPMARASWPTRTFFESPSAAGTSSPAWTRITARSVSGSSPIRSARCSLPSARVTSSCSASWTTWLLVRMYPLEVKTNPEPVPRLDRPRPDRGNLASM